MTDNKTNKLANAPRFNGRGSIGRELLKMAGDGVRWLTTGLEQLCHDKMRLEKDNRNLQIVNAKLIAENTILQNQLREKDDVIAQLQQKIEELQALIQIPQDLIKTTQMDGHTKTIPEPQTLSPDSQTLQDPQSSQWLDVLPENICCVILGAPGTGKSALGHMLLELFRFKQTPYIMGFPQDQRYLLPDWIRIANSFDEAPPNSTILLDEAYLKFNSRRSVFNKDTQEMSRALGLSRQRGHSLIFVTHGVRLLDKNIIDYANLFLIKRPGNMSMRFDRPEIRKVMESAQEAFKGASGDKRHCYVFSPEKEFEGILEVSLPSYWSEDLSHAYAGVGGSSTSCSIPFMSKAEKKRQAKVLRKTGLSYEKIAKRLGIRSKSTIMKWVKHK